MSELSNYDIQTSAEIVSTAVPAPSPAESSAESSSSSSSSTSPLLTPDAQVAQVAQVTPVVQVSVEQLEEEHSQLIKKLVEHLFAELGAPLVSEIAEHIVDKKEHPVQETDTVQQEAQEAVEAEETVEAADTPENTDESDDESNDEDAEAVNAEEEKVKTTISRDDEVPFPIICSLNILLALYGIQLFFVLCALTNDSTCKC